jgi:hypothetical protein
VDEKAAMGVGQFGKLADVRGVYGLAVSLTLDGGPVMVARYLNVTVYTAVTAIASATLHSPAHIHKRTQHKLFKS